jgi:cell division septation protein DedD
VCAEDDLAATRDAFVFVLAKALAAHVPSALVVDCDFLKVGLHGLVPQPDALGFLDFLLYGSSIGVVTQEPPGGVRVISAGSFPVTKRMPFVTGAFDDAARRLAAHARCVVFVGPLLSDDGAPHPLATEVDLTVVVRGDAGAKRARGSADAGAIEETIGAEGIDVWSVRTGAVERAPVSPPPAEPRPTPAAPPAAEVPRKPVAAAPARMRPSEVPDAPESRYSSIVPRIALLLFALLVIGFVSWWMWQNRSKRVDEPAATSTPSTEIAAASAVSDSAVAVDTTRVAPPDTVAAQRDPLPVPVRPADTGGRTGGTVLVDPADILVMEDLEARWKDWYAIHISSFQESIRAREEVSFLQSREFPVFIVFLDLGPKGKWYRVYAGPFETREEARDVKKNLDAIAQVRFTRITRIPE